jgi:hypothetical protein
MERGAECYYRHNGVMDLACKNAVMDMEEKMPGRHQRLSQPRSDWIGKSAPSLTYHRDTRLRIGAVCKEGLFVYEP